MKVAWICHFHNQEIEKFLKLRCSINEFAPWITELIKIFEPETDIDLYIIAPHRGIRKNTSFKINNISFHFYSIGIPIFNKYTFSIYDLITNYYFLKKKVWNLIERINPDIIHLFGAENAYYSSTIFQFNGKYPILISIQGFLQDTQLKKNYKIRKRIKIEKNILTHFKNFGIRTKYMENRIKAINPHAELFHHNFPTYNSIKRTSETKIFDCIFFARISKDKGIEDLLLSTKQIVKTKSDFSLLIIGDGSVEYINFLKGLCNFYNINSNVHWKGFVPLQDDLFKYVLQSRICVLPTYYDIIPGTIIESMFLKVPVISYDVGGIPEINNKEEVIRLVPAGDIQALTDSILNLLNDNDLLLKYSEKGYSRAFEMFDREIIKTDIKTAYTKILNLNK